MWELTLLTNTADHSSSTEQQAPRYTDVVGQLTTFTASAVERHHPSTSAQQVGSFRSCTVARVPRTSQVQTRATRALVDICQNSTFQPFKQIKSLAFLGSSAPLTQMQSRVRALFRYSPPAARRSQAFTLPPWCGLAVRYSQRTLQIGHSACIPQCCTHLPRKPGLACCHTTPLPTRRGGSADLHFLLCVQWNVAALALAAVLLLAGQGAQAAPQSRRLLEQTIFARRNLLVSILVLAVWTVFCSAHYLQVMVQHIMHLPFLLTLASMCRLVATALPLYMAMVTATAPLQQLHYLVSSLTFSCPCASCSSWSMPQDFA